MFGFNRKKIKITKERRFELEQLKRAEEEREADLNRRLTLDRTYAKKDDVELTEEQKKAVDEFWGKYSFVFTPNYNTFKTYMNRTGVFDPKYMPYGAIKPLIYGHSSPEEYRTAFQNKAYLEKIYQNVKLPVTFLRKIEGIYYNDKHEKITIEEAVNIAYERLKKVEIVIKPSGLSGGKGIVFLSEATKDQLMDEFERMPKLMVVQEALKQHPFMKSLNPSTVNTVRLTTTVINGEFHPLAALIKIGNNGVRVDNYKHGGHLLGINMDGRTNTWALDINRNHVSELPTGIDLSEGLEIPGFKSVIETAEKAHLQTPRIKIISWDIAIDEDAEAVIIEANHNGDIRMHQATTGPIYGDLTEEIMNQLVLKNFYRLKGNEAFDYKEYHNHIAISRCAVNRNEVVVPKKIDGKPVTSIEQDCFKNCNHIKTVVLPDSIRTIGNKAFAECSSLEYVNIPNKLRKIGKNCFVRCENLTNKNEWKKYKK